MNETARIDQKELGEIYDLYADRIYHYIYVRVGDQRLAEDLSAEVFIRMLEAVRVSAGWHTSLSGWLYRIAHNLVVDHFRRKPQREVLELDERIVSTEGSPLSVVEKRLTQQKLRSALRNLTEDQQQVIVLKYMEGLSNLEVAQVMDKTEGAIKALQHRALASLRRVLEEQEA